MCNLTPPTVSLIACVDIDNGIGLNGTIPWKLPPDMKRFRELTTGGIVIMGRLTWESIGSKPLPNRINIVVTSSPWTIPRPTMACSQFVHAIDLAKSLLKPIFIIGGSSIYAEGMKYASRVYLTRINKRYGCDVEFPNELLESFKKRDITDWTDYLALKYRYETYNKK